MSQYPPTLLADFYKVSHRQQYPAGTEYVYSTWIARGSRLEGVNHVVAFGIQAFVQKYLIDYFNDNFFDRPKQEVLDEYIRVIRFTLGVAKPDASHLADLHDLGYLPLEIKAVPEGTLVPTRVPMATIENTDARFFWLTNYIETLFSVESWMPSTSATIAFEYRKLIQAYAEKTGGDLTAVPFQGHDFSMRGMASVEAAAASGAGHLLSFTGTDTIPAILFHEKYYGADIERELVGASIPATEHSVMCAYGNEGEIETFRHLIEDLYPGGFVSVVSDTWDLWRVLGEYLPELKDKILARDGRVVIRPDSGDPVDIIAGTELQWQRNNPADEYTLSEKGVIEVLWDLFGGTVNEKGYKVLDPHIGAIYGDSITLDRADRIMDRLEAKGFCSTNVVFGIGSYTYQYNTRDTFMFALKSTWVQVNGVERQIFKDPITDDGTKKSLKGRVVVIDNKKLYPKTQNVWSTSLSVIDKLTLEQANGNEDVDVLKTVFFEGTPMNVQTLGEIRERLLSNL